MVRPGRVTREPPAIIPIPIPIKSYGMLLDSSPPKHLAGLPYLLFTFSTLRFFLNLKIIPNAFDPANLAGELFGFGSLIR
jgi:hypothetical protein